MSVMRPTKRPVSTWADAIRPKDRIMVARVRNFMARIRSLAFICLLMLGEQSEGNGLSERAQR